MLLAFVRGFIGAGFLIKPIRRLLSALQVPAKDCLLLEDGRAVARWPSKPWRCRPIRFLVPMPFGGFHAGHVPGNRPYRRAGYGAEICDLSVGTLPHCRIVPFRLWTADR
jgi:hypothetical protein